MYALFPRKSTIAKKWTKFRKGLQGISDLAFDHNGFILTADLRSVAGLGVNVTEVYPWGDVISRASSMHWMHGDGEGMWMAGA